MENLKELSFEEMVEVDGGLIIAPVIRWAAKTLVGGLAYEVWSDGWEKCKEDFIDGFNSTCNDC